MSMTITEAWLLMSSNLRAEAPQKTENTPQVHLDTVPTMQENQESHMDTHPWADILSYPFPSHCQYNSVQMVSKTPCRCA